MPRGSPFTALCQQINPYAQRVVADLHLHSTASDGDWTPSQVVQAARLARLNYFTLSDHDTTAGWAEVRAALAALTASSLQFIPAIELSTVWQDREYHLLAFFTQEPDATLQHELRAMQQQRQQRFADYLQNANVQWNSLVTAYRQQLEATCSSVGRRHVTLCIMKQGLAETYQQAWQQYVAPLGEQVAPKRLMPLADAIEMLHSQRAFTSLAHPPRELTYEDFQSLRAMHLDGWEMHFPAALNSRRIELRQWAKQLGAIATGGSDFHSPGQPLREIGGTGLSATDVQPLLTALAKPAATTATV